MAPRPTKHHGEELSETLVRFIVEHAMGVRVCCYVFRTGDSRPDAIIHRHGGVPLEIVSDPDKAGNRLASALRKAGRPAKFEGLNHGYKVLLTKTARVKDIGSWLEPTLRLLDDPATRDGVPRQTENYASILPFPFIDQGEVIFATDSGGGRPNLQPADVVQAASAMLARPEYADVARKLSAYGGVERHAAVIVDDDQTSAFRWLREATPADLNQLPLPQLVDEITHLWITPRYLPGLAIEDSLPGATAARAAGIWVIGAHMDEPFPGGVVDEVWPSLLGRTPPDFTTRQEPAPPGRTV
jgi:hypothetical protein